jgi:hypothetical protein
VGEKWILVFSLLKSSSPLDIFAEKNTFTRFFNSMKNEFQMEWKLYENERKIA